MYKENTYLALDKSANTAMIRIADDLDVANLSVGREMIVESTDQLSVIHRRGETSNEDARLVRELLEIPVPRGDGACGVVC